jgi:hypothetical protein
LISPGSLVLDGSHAANATLSVTTTARSSLGGRWRLMPLIPGLENINGIFIWLLATLVASKLFMAALRTRKLRLVPLAALLSFLLALVNCGGGGGGSSGGAPTGTPAGVYTLTISAAGPGALSHSVTVTLIVN